MTHADTPVGRLATWVDERLGIAKLTTGTLNYVFPKHFSFLFGELVLYSFVVLVITGVFLALLYSPGEARVVYDGEYGPLVGVTMSEAFRSVLDLSFSVRAGLLMRQTHHWAANVFTAGIVLHMARVFFTGAFRRPREITWISGVTLALVALIQGFTGYSMLDDLLSGAGMRIGYTTFESVPVVGPTIVRMLWGGEYPGTGFLSRLFTLHIFVLPAIITALLSVHMLMVARPHHTQFRGPGRTEGNVVGIRLWPSYATLSVGFMFLITAVLVAMGGFLQINPVWLYGPYDVFAVSSGSQADWYLMWAQGALRLMPSWAPRFGDWAVPNPFFPGVLFPALVVIVLYLWPFLEARVTGDREAHHLLDRPRDRPVRTAIGAGAISLLLLLTTVAGDDVIAATFDWPIVVVRNVERVLFFVLPAAVALVTWKLARDLAAQPEEPSAGDATSAGEGTSASGQDLDRGRVWVPARLAAGFAALAVARAAVGRLRRRR